MKFISDANLSIHKEEFERMKHRRAIFEKSYGVELKTVRDAYRSHIPLYEREETVELITNIILHDVFFSSFGFSGHVSVPVRKRYGSEASFLYELYECAKAADGGFLMIFSNENGKIEFCAGREYKRQVERNMPCLALDLEEHAYFYDYLFERDSYIKSALSQLDLSKI